MSSCEHEFPGPSLATRLYLPLLPSGLLGLIMYRHRTVVYRASLVFLPLVVHVKGSTEVYHL